MEQIKIDFESVGHRQTKDEIIKKYDVGPGVKDKVFQKDGEWYVDGKPVEKWKKDQDDLYDPSTDTTINGSNRAR